LAEIQACIQFYVKVGVVHTKCNTSFS